MDMTRYEQNRPQFKFGDYLAWSGNGPISDGIKLRTQDWRPPYEKEHDINISHSSLLMRLPLYQGLDDRILTIEALNDGLVLHLLSQDLWRPDGSAKYDGKLYWYPLTDEIGTDAFRRKVGRLALKYLGTPYAFEDIAKLFVERVKLHPDHLFCSGACQVAYCGEQAFGQIALVPNEIPLIKGLFKPPVLIYDSKEGI